MNLEKMYSIINCYDICKIIESFFDKIQDIVHWSMVNKTIYYRKLSIPHDILIYIPNSKLINSRYTILCLNAHPKFTALELRTFTNLLYISCNKNVTNFTLSKMKKLKALKCNNNSKITGSAIQKLNLLEVLFIGNNVSITDNDVSKLTKLNVLMTGSTKTLTDISISNLYNLELLYIPFNYFTNDAFKQLNKLTKLYCGQNNLDDACLQYLPNLEELSIGNNNFTLKGLSVLPKLQVLILHETKYFNNSDFKYINRIKYLNCINNSTITDEALLYLTNLTHLRKCGPSITDIGLSSIANTLVELDCGFNKNFTNESLTKLVNLNILDCGYNNHITDKTLKSLTTLTHLGCSKNKKITNIGLSKLQNLIYLHKGSNRNITKDYVSRVLNIKTIY